MRRVLVSGFALFFLILVALPIFAFAAAQAAPGFESFIVVSGSMEPEIKTGSVIFSQEVEPSEIGVGDIVTYRSGGEYTTHKVIEVLNGTELEFRTKGIANESPDPQTVSEDQIVGRELLTIPYLGYFLRFAGSPEGILLLVIIPASAIILLESIELVSELRSD